MKQEVERLADSARNVSRRWWQVRRKLLVSLAGACGSAALAWMQPEVRITIVSSVLRPMWGTLNLVAHWELWPALGIAVVLGGSSWYLVQRIREQRGGSSSRVRMTA